MNKLKLVSAHNLTIIGIIYAKDAENINDKAEESFIFMKLLIQRIFLNSNQ